MGIMMTLARIYPVETQVISSTDAPSVPRMCGRATLTMLMSSEDIMLPVMTAKAINHLCGLRLSSIEPLFFRQLWSGLAAYIDSWNNRHARPQRMVWIELGIDNNFNRNPLHNFHKITCRILRRQ